MCVDGRLCEKHTLTGHTVMEAGADAKVGVALLVVEQRCQGRPHLRWFGAETQRAYKVKENAYDDGQQCRQ